MQIKSKTFIVAGAMASVGFAASARAVTIDGTLDTGVGGYGAPLAVQTQTSNSGSGLGQDSNRTPSQNQLSNAYGLIDLANGKLDIFLGGAVNLNNERFFLAIDANPTTGVADLTAGTHSGVLDTGNVPTFSDQPGNVQPHDTSTSVVKFDAGFRPETLIEGQFGGGNIFFDENLLTGVEAKDDYSSDPQNGAVSRGPASGDAGGVNFTVAVNNAAQNTLVTAANAAAVTTGFEIQFSLAELGYVAGSPVNVSSFITEGSNTLMTNQVLAANSGNAADPYGLYNFDFTDPVRDPGSQYFTIPAPTTGVPEPASLSLLALSGLGLLRRRAIKA